MKDQVLKLCRRLKKTTLNELVSILEIDTNIIKKCISELKNEGAISINGDLVVYLSAKNLKQKRIETKRIETMFEFREDYEKEIIMKSFCLEIPPQKVAILLRLNKSCICNYYLIFRRMLYERQLKELKKHFFEKPQIARYRQFYDKNAFFYVYNNYVFVTDKILRGKKEKNYSKSDIRKLSITYSFLRRVESHNVNESYMFHRLSEYIWRKDREYEYLYTDLKQNLLNKS